MNQEINLTGVISGIVVFISKCEHNFNESQKPAKCVDTKTRVVKDCLQTKLTTDTVIPDNVFDLEVGGLQQDSNYRLVYKKHPLIEDRAAID